MTMNRLVKWLAMLAAVAAFGTGSAAAQTASPVQAGHIAFWDFNTGQVYSIAPDGSELRQLTHVDADHAAIRPKWSPDGRSIMFTLVRINTSDDHARIWIMRADGTRARQLSHDLPGYRNYTGSFTPDGRTIVFARCQPNDGVCAIWKMTAAGTHRRPITPFRVGRNETVDFDPDVSPTGAIAFGRFQAHGIAAQIWLKRHTRGPARPVTPAWLEAFAADWGPAGHTLTVSSNSAHPNSKLYRLRADASHLTRLTNPPFPNNDFGARHSPDERRLTFSTDRRFADLCCVQLAIAHVDGTHLHIVPTGQLNGVVEPDWGRASQAVTDSNPTSLQVQANRTITLPAVCRATPTTHHPYC